LEAVFGPASPEILLTATQDSAVIRLGANAPLSPEALSPEPSRLPPIKFFINYIWHEGQALKAIQLRPSDAQLEELVTQ
jgi:hypothetical protein